jgi:hypothetical protein
MLHKLDLTSSESDSSTETKTSQPIVDDERLVANNQPAYTATAGKKTSMKNNSLVMTIVISVVAIAAGLGTGYGTHRLFANGGGSSTSGNLEQIATGSVKAGDTFGSADKDTFKDKAKGYLEKGGLDGEGSHRLLRPGGPSQTVYMTSSVTDLDKFDGMEVEVWGETFSSQKAGWLMDVGRVEVLNVSGERPAEADEE